MKISLKFISFSLLLVSFRLFGQNGAALDLTFNSGDSIPYGTGIGPGGTSAVYDFKVQTDGRMILGGVINQYNDRPVSKIFRIMANGDLDTSFHASISATGEYVKAICIQPDGKILLGGNFTAISGTPINRLVRLNTDGSIDPTFNVGTGITGSNAVTTVEEIQLDANGKILIGGRFNQYNGSIFKGLVRLNADGFVDNTFSIGLGFTENSNDPGIFAIEFQNDGKLLIGGRFNGYNGQAINHFVRLNPDGSWDNTLATGTGFSSVINSINYLPNGKFILAGAFSSYNGTPAGRIIRLNADGSFDFSFNTNGSGTLSLAGANSEIHKTVILSDGRMIAAGTFTTYNSVPSPALISLSANGYTDSVSSFVGAQSIIYHAAVLPNGRLVVAGSFSKGIAKFLLPERATDYSFLPGGAFNNSVHKVAVQADNKILVNGNFTSYFGSQDKNFCRLNEDGSIDPSFQPGFFNYPSIKDMVVLSDGKILMTGGYTSLDTLTRYATRLNPDGSIDPTFLSETNTSVYGNKLLLLPSGKILIGGTNFIYRLNANGTPDNTFTPPGITGAINALGLLPNGKILVGGDFSAHTPAPFFVPLGSKLVLLDSTGVLDSTFQITLTGQNPLINDLIIQDDQQVIIAGKFSSINGVNRYNLCRLNADGSVNMAFTAYTNGTVTEIEQSADGRILVAGVFTTLNGVPKQYLGRVNPNGSLDLSFNLSLNLSVTSMVRDSDDRIILGGAFTSMGNQQRNRIARINQGCPFLYSSDTVTEISAYTWPANGNTYTLSGQYQDTVASAAGCDSIVVLNLTLTQLNVTCFTSPSQVDSCNGSVHITATGIPGFTFDLGNGTSYTSSQHAVFDSLCPGFHTVLVTDGNGDTLSVDFIVPSDSTYLVSDPFDDDDLISDSIVVLIENCDIDFSSIDSVSIDSFTILSGDSVLINWAVTDANGTTIIPTILVLTPGNNYTQLQLYCVTKSIDHYFVATIGLVYNGTGISTLGLAEEAFDLFTIYPNPTNDRVHISFSGSDGDLTVYDVQGKVVLKDRVQNQGIISLENFERGVYLFDFSNSNGRSVQRVVKQ